jgi:tripartite-type tricarboxylate transporter receptor subunit TctC
VLRPLLAPFALAAALVFPPALSLVALLAPAGVHAQDNWPVKPPRIIVPYAPGGNTDQIARIAADRLSSAFGVQFVVENRAGAAGLVAADYVAKSPADGYTLFMGTLSQIATAPFTNRITYDPVKDFAPISVIGANPFVITVASALPVRTLAEFVQYVKANPGKLNYGSGGTGGLTHLSGALFVQRAGLVITHIPYKGGAPALADLLGGQVQMYSGSPSEVIQQAQAGKVRLLGISSRERARYLPDVPAIAETYPGHEALTWNGLLAPGRTPPAIIERISGEIMKAMRDPAFTARLERIGVDPVLHTPAQFARQIQAEMALWQKVIRDAGVKIED